MRLHNLLSTTSVEKSDNYLDINQELLIVSAIQIQRAWRNYYRDKRRLDIASELMAAESLNVPMQLSTSPANSDCMIDISSMHSHSQTAGGTAGNLLLSTTARHLIEPDPNSFSSDYSEMAEPIREHLANVQIICREDLAMGNTVGPGAGLPLPSVHDGIPHGLEREPEETDEAYIRRVRVTNYLSLAQEFAALKKVDSKALPFDLHRGSKVSENAGFSSSSDEGGAEDSDVDENGKVLNLEKTSASEVVSAELEKSTYPSVRNPVTSSSANSSVSNACIPDVVPNLSRPKNPSGSHQEFSIHECQTVTSSTVKVLPAVPTAKAIQQQSGTVKAPACVANDVSKVLPLNSSAVGNVGGEASGLEEFDVYTIETALPHVEWERLERQLNLSAQEEKKRRSMYGGDRDEIRRRLAMSAFDDDEATSATRARHGNQGSHTGSSTHNRMLHSATSLQVCYLNESLDADRELDLVTYNRSNCKPDIIPKSISEASTLSQYQTKNSVKNADIHEDFFAKQARLKAEAKLALAQVRPMAHMQLQVEKQSRKKSPLSEIVVGIPGFVDGKMRSLNRHMLHRMNFAQLQVVVNDLHAQIEALNADLMQQLVDRDDLHMAQDSMLVDIDDLTRRAQEYAAKVNKQTAAAEIK